MRVMLQHVAHTRTGDKGNTINVAVFAYRPELYLCLCQQLTAAVVKKHYGSVVEGEVRRYQVDGIHALNFVADGALGGGVSRSLRLDQYGKSLSAALLGLEIDVPDELVPSLHNMVPQADKLQVDQVGVFKDLSKIGAKKE